MSTETERKEDKTMTNPNDARRAHDVLNGLSAGRILSKENEQLLRSFLPELPKQKTLEELRHDVYDAWIGADGNEWADDAFGDLETWLAELHIQLKGLKDTPVDVPALPAGMRLADHAEYGRVVTSPKPDQDGVYVLLISTPKVETGADWEYAHECELTFIDGSTFRLAPPEFLETKADYTDVPEGTILTTDGLDTAWVKKFDGWASTGVSYERTSKELGYTRRRVLRWGWGK